MVSTFAIGFFTGVFTAFYEKKVPTYIQSHKPRGMLKPFLVDKNEGKYANNNKRSNTSQKKRKTNLR